MQCTFQAEVITPLLVAGADPRSPDVVREGLRPPEVRGQLRYWFRAMMGAIVGDDLKALRMLEGRVFGDTDQRSKVKVVTVPVVAFTPQTAYLRMNDPGTLTLPSGRTVAAPSRKAIPPPTPYSLRLTGVDQTELNLGLGALWLVMMLSGFGARIRRGFGSLALFPKDTETAQALQNLDLSFTYPGADLKGIAATLMAGLSRVKAVFQHYAAIGSPSPASTYRVLSAQTARLYLIRPKGRFWGRWQDAMDDLRDNVFRPLKQVISPVVNPLTGSPSIGSASPRQPSPLIIQIKRTGAGGYFGVLLAFKEDLYFGPGWGTLDSFLRGLTGYEVEAVTLP